MSTFGEYLSAKCETCGKYANTYRVTIKAYHYSGSAASTTLKCCDLCAYDFDAKYNTGGSTTECHLHALND